MQTDRSLNFTIILKQKIFFSYYFANQHALEIKFRSTRKVQQNSEVERVVRRDTVLQQSDTNKEAATHWSDNAHWTTRTRFDSLSNNSSQISLYLGPFTVTSHCLLLLGATSPQMGLNCIAIYCIVLHECLIIRPKR
jgi:hypothetical protein